MKRWVWAAACALAGCTQVSEVERPVVTSAPASEDAAIADIVARMSLERKVARLLQPQINSFTPEDMERYRFGRNVRRVDPPPARWRAGNPDDVGHGRSPRAHQRDRRNDLPAQYRSWRDTRCRPAAPHRPRNRPRDRGGRDRYRRRERRDRGARQSTPPPIPSRSMPGSRS